MIHLWDSYITVTQVINEGPPTGTEKQIIEG